MRLVPNKPRLPGASKRQVSRPGLLRRPRPLAPVKRPHACARIRHHSAFWAFFLPLFNSRPLQTDRQPCCVVLCGGHRSSTSQRGNRFTLATGRGRRCRGHSCPSDEAQRGSAPGLGHRRACAGAVQLRTLSLSHDAVLAVRVPTAGVTELLSARYR